MKSFSTTTNLSVLFRLFFFHLLISISALNINLAQTDSLDYYLDGGEVSGSLGIMIKTDVLAYLNGIPTATVGIRKGVFGAELALGVQRMPLTEVIHPELWQEILRTYRDPIESGYNWRISGRYYLPELQRFNGFEGYYIGILYRQNHYTMSSGDNFRSGEIHSLGGVELISRKGIVLDIFYGLGWRRFFGESIPNYSDLPSFTALFSLQLGYRL